MSFYGNIFKGWVNTTEATSRATSRIVQGAIVRGSMGQARRRARSGLLAPGDPDPPPNVGGSFHDYRGVLPAGTLKQLSGEPFPLGRAIDIRRGRTTRVGLGPAVVARHTAVVGPTGEGKTNGVLIPWIAAALSQQYSVVALDVLGDLRADIEQYVQRRGHVGARVGEWSPMSSTGSLGWDWLSELTDETRVRAAVEAIIGRERPNDPQPFFHQRDARVLRGAIELAQLHPGVRTGRDLLRLVQCRDEIERLVLASPRHPGAGRLMDVVVLPDDDYLRATSGVVNALDVFDSETVERATAGGQLRWRDLLDTPSLLVITTPLYGRRAAECLSSLAVALLLQTIYRRGMGGRPLLLVLDEAARLLGRLDLEELLSVARHSETSIVLAAQDVEQFPEEKERSSILGNCGTYIQLPTRSPATTAFFSSRLGKRPQSSLSHSMQQGEGGWTDGYQRSTSQVPVLGDREIMDQPFTGRPAIVHCAPLSNTPFIVDLDHSDGS